MLHWQWTIAMMRIPPLPKEYEYRSSKSNTFQKILMQDEDEKNEQRRLEERVSRSRRCKASDRVTKDLKEIMRRPTSNLLLNQKKVVSESKFRKFSDEEKYNDRIQSILLRIYVTHRTISCKLLAQLSFSSLYRR